MDSNVIKVLVEWRDARQAIFDAPHQTKPMTWERLGYAEHALMDVARSYDFDVKNDRWKRQLK